MQQGWQCGREIFSIIPSEINSDRNIEFAYSPAAETSPGELTDSGGFLTNGEAGRCIYESFTDTKAGVYNIKIQYSIVREGHAASVLAADMQSEGNKVAGAELGSVDMRIFGSHIPCDGCRVKLNVYVSEGTEPETERMIIEPGE